MPSSPQVITTRGVFDYLENTAGKPIVGATVNCTLNFNGASVTSPIVNVGEMQQSTTTDQNGFWRFNLIPNDTLTPSGTLYTIQTPASTYDISVPSGGADVQSSSIVANAPSVLSPAATNLTGPITVTGNETVTGNLSVQGTTTLVGTTTGALTTGAQTVGGDLTISSAFRLLFGATVAKIIPGATSISHRNNADSADNLLITDAGAVTVRNGLTVTAGGATITAGDAVVTAGRLLVSAAVAKLVPGATSISLRNNADTADNLILTDAGLATLRNALSIPPSAGGTLAPTSYGTVPIKIGETTLGSAGATVTFGSLPSWPKAYLLFVEFVATVAAVEARVQFNADTTANYDSQFVNATGATVSGAAAAAATGIRICTSNTTTAANVSSAFVAIFAPQTTAQQKNLIAAEIRNDGAAVLFSELNAGTWRTNNAAITSITVQAASSTFQAGGNFILWALP